MNALIERSLVIGHWSLVTCSVHNLFRGYLKSPVCDPTAVAAWHTLREASYGNHSWVVLADF
jgi:hypothetical protein